MLNSSGDFTLSIKCVIEKKANVRPGPLIIEICVELFGNVKDGYLREKAISTASQSI